MKKENYKIYEQLDMRLIALLVKYELVRLG